MNPTFLDRLRRDWLTLRKPVSRLQALSLGMTFVLLCLAGWWFVTLGAEGESRIVGPLTLPSPAETFGKFSELWNDFALTRNVSVTLRRVSVGFALALAVGVPIGVMAGCFPRVHAFLSPLIMLGRNVPLAAVVPLMIFIFGAGEKNKVMFIFVASVAFVISDAARAIMDVSARYIDTAYTLGASRWQTISKVLVPLAAPTIFSACRQMFGLAFGYIMLAESIKIADEVGGLGYQIQIFQRRGFREHIYLIILVIPMVAIVIDQVLAWIQRQLFPHVYGGDGILRALVRVTLIPWENLKSLLFHRRLASIPPAATEEGPK
ncbi:MAG: ABC transporter permease subunit [Planctomycetaceae bacterium]|nr:ABC transporter permease subunit [Planctomycetaceae bacterium]